MKKFMVFVFSSGLGLAACNNKAADTTGGSDTASAKAAQSTTSYRCHTSWSENPEKLPNAQYKSNPAPKGWSGEWFLSSDTDSAFTESSKSVVASFSLANGDKLSDDQKKYLSLDDSGKIKYTSESIKGSWYSSYRQTYVNLNKNADGTATVELIFHIEDSKKNIIDDVRTGGSLDFFNVYLSCDPQNNAPRASSLATCKKLVVQPSSGKYAPVYLSPNMDSALKIGLSSEATLENLGPIQAGTEKERIKVRVLSNSSLVETDPVVFVWSKDLKCGS